jgi:hypothetical protein
MKCELLNPDVGKWMQREMFDRHHYPNNLAALDMIGSALTASAAGEEGVYLRCALIVLSLNDTIDSWKTLLEVGTVPENDGLIGKHLGAALRRHSPLLRHAPYAFIELHERGARLAGFGTVASRHTNGSAIREKLRSGHSVAVEVRGPLHMRFDNGTISAVLKDGYFQSPEPDEDTSEVLLGRLRMTLGLKVSDITIIERLIEALRFAEHGAMYIFAEDGAAIGHLFQGEPLRADWPGLRLLLGDTSTFSPSDPGKIVATCAGFGMIDGAVLLGKDLSLWGYRAMVAGKPKKPVEGGSRSHAFFTLAEKVKKNANFPILAVMKVSTDGELDVATRPDRKRSGADA